MSKLEQIADSITARALARIFQLIGIPVVVAILGWNATALIGLQGNVIELQTQMAERTSDPYTGSDAKRDNAYILLRFDSLDARVNGLELRERVR